MLDPRYVNVLKCSNQARRLLLRKNLANVRQMLQHVSSITTKHPIWQSLIADKFRDDGANLKRVKSLFNVLLNAINEPISSSAVGITCNPTQGGCMDRLQAPGDSDIDERVTVAEYDAETNTINLCDPFFGEIIAREGMDCIDNLPIGKYKTRGGPTGIQHC